MLSPLLALSAVLMTGELHADYQLALRAEGRARQPQLGEVNRGRVAEDIEMAPSFGMDFQWRNAEGLLRYSPRLLVSELRTASGQTSIVHRGKLGLGYRPRPGLRLAISQEGLFGQEDLYSLAVSGQGTIGQLQPVPELRLLRHFQSRTELRAEARPHARWELLAQAAYQQSGGIDAISQAALPFQTAPTLLGMGTYRASALHRFVSRGEASYSAFSNGNAAAVLALSERWVHRPGRATETSLGAGGSLYRQRGNVLIEPATDFAPTLFAGVVQHVPLQRQRLSFQATSELAPYVNRLTGRVSQRGEATAQVSWAPLRTLAVVGQGRGASSLFLGPGRRESVAQAQVAVVYGLTDNLQLDAGARALWQRQEDLFRGTLFQWLAFGALTVMNKGTL